ncbi:CGNR zinc finger domain-containing protein [Rhodococcoides kyotonense]|uniref:Conserved protein containing a Zn-ribbon-like motif, possibly RNA-binding n=1 Tax=Rhodococcoides kyotonense TaxID=398843 RepID=A0A239F0A8_9NOCA|nr:CGNR zinc finger domain-containing protein [Rhodococcus kyotonensis]SNS50265.1 Conserved protein containing a Zn-ribbon-like motif, possibly RNA-binding [Rhodococcus kyotonensis]
MSPTGRFGLSPAPDGLDVVQDFLNTRAISVKGFPDLLADGASAGSTLGVELTDSDATHLRRLRSVLEDLIAGRPLAEATQVPASIRVDESGSVRLASAGHGWQAVASSIWAEVFIAQHTDIWRRLKRCRNELCGSAFYDRSRNNSGVWHDVKTCGNSANLRASRARRRPERPTPPA